MKRPLLYALAAIAALAGSFAAGRYSKPAEVVTHTEYVDRLQVVRTTVVDRVVDRVTDIKWKRVVVTQPDGSTTTTEESHTAEKEKIAENTKVEEKRESETAGATKSTQTTTRPDWQISALVGVTYSGGSSNTLNSSTTAGLPLRVSVGAHVQRRILGPVSVGVFGLSSGTFGLSAGLQF